MKTIMKTDLCILITRCIKTSLLTLCLCLCLGITSIAQAQQCESRNGDYEGYCLPITSERGCITTCEGRFGEYSCLDRQDYENNGICSRTGDPIPTPVNGSCGASTFDTFPSAPTTDLCTVGTPTPVLGAGPYIWTCRGRDGGRDDTCIADRTQISATCGSATNTPTPISPTTDLCTIGSPSVVNSNLANFSRSCSADTISSCSTLRQYTATFNTQRGVGTSFSSKIILYGQSIGFLPTPPTKPGHLFNGRWTAPTGGSQLNSGPSWFYTTQLVLGDATYYAQWIVSERTASCLGSLPANSTNNSTMTSWVQTLSNGTRGPEYTYNYNTTRGNCTFVCNTNYNRDGSACIANTQTATCGGTIPADSVSNATQTSLIQTRGGNNTIPGTIQDGYAFLGSTITIPNSTALRLTKDKTICMWLKPDNFATRQNPYNKAYGGEGTITQEVNGSLTFFYGTNGGDNQDYRAHSSTPLIVNQRNYICLVTDLSVNNQIHRYINGVQNSKTSEYPEFAPSNVNAILGRGYAGAYNGSMDEFRIYDRALSQGEITNIGNNILPISRALVLEYNFDNSKDRLRDTSTRGHHGSANNQSRSPNYNHTYSTTPGICTFACASGRIWNGSACINNATCTPSIDNIRINNRDDLESVRAVMLNSGGNPIINSRNIIIDSENIIVTTGTSITLTGRIDANNHLSLKITNLSSLPQFVQYREPNNGSFYGCNTNNRPISNPLTRPDYVGLSNNGLVPALIPTRGSIVHSDSRDSQFWAWNRPSAGFRVECNKCNLIVPVVTQTGTCVGLPTNAIANTATTITQYTGINGWTPSTGYAFNPIPGTGSCNFVCRPNYTRDGSTCAPNTPSASCGTLPANTTSTNGTTYIQTRDGTKFTPITNYTFFSNNTNTICGYRCNTNYTRNGSACIADTRTVSCGTQPANTTANNGTTYIQTWTPGGWDPVVSWNQGTSGSCSYSCAGTSIRNPTTSICEPQTYIRSGGVWSACNIISPVYGTCGTAHGQSYTSLPSDIPNRPSRFCAPNNIRGEIMGTGPRTWTCTLNGGSIPSVCQSQIPIGTNNNTITVNTCGSVCNPNNNIICGSGRLCKPADDGAPTYGEGTCESYRGTYTIPGGNPSHQRAMC